MIRARPLLASIIAGVVLTTLVAWGCSLYGSFTEGELSATYDTENSNVPRGLVPEGWSPRSWHWYRGLGLRRDLVSESDWMGSTLGMTMDGRPQRTVTHVRAGWPMAALTWYDYHSHAPPPGTPWVEKAWWMGLDPGPLAPKPISGPTRWRIDARIPIRPLVLGFIVDAVFWGLVAWGLMLAGGAWRRAHRRRRGLCLVCGYASGGFPTCPECGQGSRAAASA